MEHPKANCAGLICRSHQRAIVWLIVTYSTEALTVQYSTVFKLYCLPEAILIATTMYV